MANTLWHAFCYGPYQPKCTAEKYRYKIGLARYLHSRNAFEMLQFWHGFCIKEKTFVF